MTKRISELDFLRVIGCLSVIIIHVTAQTLVQYEPNSPHLKMAYLTNSLIKYAVPLFIFISGFVFAYVYRSKPFHYWQYLKKRVLLVGGPYLFWSIIFYVYYIYQGIYRLSVEFFLEKVLTGTLVYHLYYVIIIFQFYVLSKVMHFIWNRWNPLYLLSISALINYLSMRYISFQYSDRFFANYLVFFALGCYFGTMKGPVLQKLIKKRYAIYVLSLLVGLLYTYELYQANVNYIRPLFNINLLWYAFSFLAIISWYLLAVGLNRKENCWIKRGKPIGDASYYIYLSHPLFLSFSWSLVNRLGIMSVTLEMVFNMVFVLLLSVGISVSYVKVKEKVRDLAQVKGSET